MLGNKASQPPTVVDAHGQPYTRSAEDGKCPRCHAGAERRVASGGFGRRHPVCGQCGCEFRDEEWHD